MNALFNSSQSKHFWPYCVHFVSVMFALVGGFIGLRGEKEQGKRCAVFFLL